MTLKYFVVNHLSANSFHHFTNQGVCSWPYQIHRTDKDNFDSLNETMLALQNRIVYKMLLKKSRKVNCLEALLSEWWRAGGYCVRPNTHTAFAFANLGEK